VGRLQRGSPAEVLDLLQFLAKAYMRKCMHQPPTQAAFEHGSRALLHT
jgi:hypothetical protein